MYGAVMDNQQLAIGPRCGRMRSKEIMTNEGKSSLETYTVVISDQFGLHAHLRFTSVAHPSMPSPLLPGTRPRSTSCIPRVSFIHSCDAIPPAFARFSGSTSSIGRRKSLMAIPCDGEKWYFSLSTSGNDQWRSLWILRSSPLRLNISCDQRPERQSDFGKLPSSSIT